MERIFSPGKLLLTSEYFVLDGSKALALPTKLGQDFFYEVIDDKKSLIYWTTQYQGIEQFNLILDYTSWEIIGTNNITSARFIVQTLQNLKKLGSDVFNVKNSYNIITNVQFPADYGLGSSSTLMTNLATWANVNPFILNEQSLGGSGYDIAVAKEQCSLLFWREKNLPKYEKVDFSPNFREDLIFIHLNKKQNSREGIELYKSKKKSLYLVQAFTELTLSVVSTSSKDEFSTLMKEHETLVSNFIEQPTVKDLYFKECPVFVKSLGAWGGDFVMSFKFENYKKYFTEIGFNTLFTWNDMISS